MMGKKEKWRRLRVGAWVELKPIYPPRRLGATSEGMGICTRVFSRRIGRLIMSENIPIIRCTKDGYHWYKPSTRSRVYMENVRGQPTLRIFHMCPSPSRPLLIKIRPPRPRKFRPPLAGFSTNRIHLINWCISFHSCQIFSPPKRAL